MRRPAAPPRLRRSRALRRRLAVPATCRRRPRAAERARAGCPRRARARSSSRSGHAAGRRGRRPGRGPGSPSPPAPRERPRRGRSRAQPLPGGTQLGPKLRAGARRRERLRRRGCGRTRPSCGRGRSTTRSTGRSRHLWRAASRAGGNRAPVAARGRPVRARSTRRRQRERRSRSRPSLLRRARRAATRSRPTLPLRASASRSKLAWRPEGLRPVPLGPYKPFTPRSSGDQRRPKDSAPLHPYQAGPGPRTDILTTLSPAASR